MSMLGRFGQIVPPLDLRCHYVTCTDTLGLVWRGVVATEHDLWATVEVRICVNCVQIINEVENKRGWLLRMSVEGWVYPDPPWVVRMWGLKAKW